jgi:hypothetical protein
MALAMAHPDLRGNPCGTASAAARAAAETALWRMMSFYDTPLADLDDAAAHDEAWSLPHTLRAGFLLSLTEPALAEEAAQHLARAETLAEHAPARERAHATAVRQLLEGRWDAACKIWDGLLLEHPRDALALQWAQLWDFHRGDIESLRSRPARALPDWDESDPLFPHVLALHAFGLEENNLYPQAEEAGRRALSLEPRAPWAVHAVAHVMEMQGRFEEGSAWLRQHQPAWGEGNGFAAHLWWHKGLFRLEALDTTGVLRLIDSHFSGSALQIGLQRLDAASLLWRLRLLGEDVAAPCRALVDGWACDEAHAGQHAFNDWHIVMALLGAGDVARAERWLARCAERALAAEDARRNNHAVARGVGLPVLRALVAFERGQHDAAVDILFAARPQARALGGSHAQRDVIDQTLFAAAAAGGRRSTGRAVLNERTMAKPVTPLTRHWIEALGEPTEQRA